MAERNNKILGARMKKARLAKGYTQSKLAEGICTQAQVSNIEKGTINDNPSSHTLFLLSEKLGTSMSYLYGQDHFFHGVSEDVEFEELRDVIRRVKSRRDYDTLNYIIKNELQELNDADEFFVQYLKWHQAIVVYYLERDIVKAESLITEALAINTGGNNLKTSIQNIRVKMSYANFLTNEVRNDEADSLYNECLSEYEEIRKSFDMNFELMELHNYIILNLSTVYMNLEKYEDSIKVTTAAIDQSLKYNSMVSLGDLYYQLGLAYLRTNNPKLYFENIKLSLSVFDLQENAEMHIFVTKRAEKTKNELNFVTESK